MENKKNDEKLIKIALATVAMELLKTIIELLIKIIELVGGQ